LPGEPARGASSMDFDLDLDRERERERLRRGYRSCRVGFSVYGFILVVAALVSGAGMLLLIQGMNPNVGFWLGIDAFHSRFGTFHTWARLFACLALAVAWPSNRGWTWRAGLLLVLAIGDIGLWAAIEAVPLGLARGPSRHLVFFQYLRSALAWSRFLLLASLATDFGRHVAMPRARELGRAAMSTATVAAAIWFVLFLSRIDWDARWPLVERRWTPETVQLMILCEMLQIVCLVQTSVLTILAGRAATRPLREMAKEDRWLDLGGPAWGEFDGTAWGKDDGMSPACSHKGDPANRDRTPP